MRRCRRAGLSPRVVAPRITAVLLWPLPRPLVTPAALQGGGTGFQPVMGATGKMPVPPALEVPDSLSSVGEFAQVADRRHQRRFSRHEGLWIMLDGTGRKPPACRPPGRLAQSPPLGALPLPTPPEPTIRRWATGLSDRSAGSQSGVEPPHSKGPGTGVGLRDRSSMECGGLTPLSLLAERASRGSPLDVGEEQAGGRGTCTD